MTNKEYIKLAQRTSATERSSALVKFSHGAIGLCTESGELIDILKRKEFYGKPLDSAHIKEELGDIFWYIAEICAAFDLTFEEIMEANIRKLHARYPEKFTSHKALNRNLTEERKALQ